MILETPRLRIRSLTDADTEPFVAMLTDPEIMRFVSPVPISPEQARGAAMHYRRVQETNGYGWWALEVNGGPSFAGIILLQDVEFEAAFTPAREVGWLLMRDQWGKGYATEGARAALEYAFTVMKLDEVVALTTAINRASQRVMQRLGMTHDSNDDFDHPHLHGTALERCVLYRARQRVEPKS